MIGAPAVDEARSLQTMLYLWRSVLDREVCGCVTAHMMLVEELQPQKQGQGRGLERPRPRPSP